ncbi:hypothetical protein NNJEOMEG_02610 [Fundidesulfovibrio magnetotacticus]|uniref:Uncharacterized protein n=1 Tax=Fundidesulfovibrio magnetotacticus TaxID=2730080 RepID=A0A6V8LQH9_9BACT|nr:hypothetical protein NNJEOMEG_02610 [Fundidesulfovibrio magnetotacticus]
MGGILRFDNPAASGRVPWTRSVSLNIDILFSLYASKGDVTISGATSIPTTQDGPIQVVRYRNLVVNALLTATNRCRGLVILCDTLVVGASGSISMSARGAAGSRRWVNQDILIPTIPMLFSGKYSSYEEFLKWVRETGFCVFDPNLYAAPQPGQPDVQANYAAWPGNGAALVSAVGGGAGVIGGAAGVTGGAGVAAPGGGGAGANPSASGIYSGPGRVWGGGAGAGAISTTGGTNMSAKNFPDQLGGAGGDAVGYSNESDGGGAGNPGGAGAGVGSPTSGGTGTGGPLFIICRGAVTLTAGHSLSVNGVAGGNGVGGTGNRGGGGSGAGRGLLARKGALTGTPNATATGGPGGTGSSAAGGPGGAGAFDIKTFAEMGW